MKKVLLTKFLFLHFISVSWILELFHRILIYISVSRMFIFWAIYLPTIDLISKDNCSMTSLINLPCVSLTKKRFTTVINVLYLFNSKYVPVSKTSPHLTKIFTQLFTAHRLLSKFKVPMSLPSMSFAFFLLFYIKMVFWFEPLYVRKTYLTHFLKFLLYPLFRNLDIFKPNKWNE